MMLYLCLAFFSYFFHYICEIWYRQAHDANEPFQHDLREGLRLTAVDGAECSPDTKGADSGWSHVRDVCPIGIRHGVVSIEAERSRRVATDRIGNKPDGAIADCHVHAACVIAGGGIETTILIQTGESFTTGRGIGGKNRLKSTGVGSSVTPECPSNRHRSGAGKCGT